MVAPIAWPFLTNWDNGVNETLSWSTAILTSRTGAEQRQALRVGPRRQIDVPLILTSQERLYAEMLLARNGGVSWLAPIPHEEVAVGPVVIGQTTFTFDTSYREISVGTRMILRDRDAMRTEIVEVTSVASDHIVTTAANNAYTSGTLTPTFLGVITENVAFSRLTARVYTGTVRFTSVMAVVWPPTDRPLATMPSFTVGGKTFPILTAEPNAVNALDYTFARAFSTIDNTQSNPLYVDKSGRAFTSQKYEWFLYGRQERSNFRDLLFTLKGKCKPLWVPTFNDDLAIGQGYPDPQVFGDAAPPPGREYYAQFLRDGTVHGYAAAAMNTGERIPSEVYDSTLVQRNSFISLKRLDVDAIEIMHHVNSDGIATVSAIFRDAPDLRVPMTMTTQGFRDAGFHPHYTDDAGTTIAAVNASTGLSDSVTITGAAGGA